MISTRKDAAGRKACGLTLCALLLTSALVLGDGREASACSSTAVGGPARLTSFDTDELVFGFYAGPENGGDVDAVITVANGDCVGYEAQVSYTTEMETAVAPDDFTTTSGTTPLMCNDLHREEYCDPDGPDGPEPMYPDLTVVPIPVHGDDEVEPAIETARFKLTSAQVGTLGTPSNWPVYVIDEDGEQRGSLEPGSGDHPAAYTVLELRTAIQVPVFLAGPADGDVAVPYEVLPYGADPAEIGAPGDDGIDVAVDGTEQVTFASGDRVARISFPHMDDSEIEGAEQLEIRLPGATGPGSRVIVTISDNETKTDFEAPVTKFHHPRHKVTYDNDDLRYLGELHTWVTEKGGAGVHLVETALRRKMENGRCKWWDGSGFAAGACASYVWHKMRFAFTHPYNEDRHLYIRKVPKKLRPSSGTSIASYRVWSRASDTQTNVESTFTKGRNDNLFWVKP